MSRKEAIAKKLAIFNLAKAAKKVDKVVKPKVEKEEAPVEKKKDKKKKKEKEKPE